MRVDPKDGCCQSCGDELSMTDVDDATISVEFMAGRIAWGDGDDE